MHDTKPNQDELEAGMCHECAGYGCYECSETGCSGIGRHFYDCPDEEQDAP